MEDYLPSSRGGGPGINNNMMLGVERRYSANLDGDGGGGGEDGTIETSMPSRTITPTQQNITENILFMKLFHEFKQLYPKVPDETVSQCVRQVSRQIIFI